jgi:hypothetical protein
LFNATKAAFNPLPNILFGFRSSMKGYLPYLPNRSGDGWGKRSVEVALILALALGEKDRG